MIDQDVLIRSVAAATSEVFSTMLDMETRMAGISNGIPPVETGIISVVGVTGDWGGSGVFCCGSALASLISERMLGGDPTGCGAAVDDEVLDAVAEVANMVVGNIKNLLEPVTGPLAISIPTVIYGRNFHFRNTTGLNGTALVFDAGQERFEVRISLAPTPRGESFLSRIPILRLAHTSLQLVSV